MSDIPNLEDHCSAVLGDCTDKKTKSIGTRYRLNEEGDLFRKIGDRFVKVPTIHERALLLKEVHDGHGHYGQDATWKRLYLQYWWPKAYEETKNYVKSCVPCQLFANLPENLPVVGKVPVNHLFERFGIDYIGPFPESRSGNKYIIMAIEYFTNWPVAKAVKKADSETTVKFLYEEIFCNFGPVEKILSDNGSHFTSKEVEEFAKYVNTRHQFSAPYKPSTNGKVEHVNNVIAKGIKKMVMNNKKNWNTLLPAMLQVNQEEEIFKEEEPLIKKSARIEIGDHVIMKNYLKKDKLDSAFKNKVFTVIDKFHNNTFVLVNDEGVKLKRAINGAHLKNFVQRQVVNSKLIKK
ncbi:hypothetical protein RO3G_00308 [Rhizopus delemar RA 99-880]|uniref:Integrase catalytic domain-containing protein n=1 Tax=Rhizopus delemar (strain RA 99-880 / ATCC MYA-4621 / FGSC 9543 / NRRL 43880) TaxID=246409 RepID=I1BHC4_RHIO9|nr:hypothetical protein RO3G_00308 [Rhizopus delemar RA 99-880]|eukprot:EIE75604.1 hypothetical protein RO3G_00308 [Rhizopus delemar RA 99-880]